MKRDDGLVRMVVSRMSACVSEIEFVYGSAHSLALCIGKSMNVCERGCAYFLLQLKPDQWEPQTQKTTTFFKVYSCIQ